MSQADDVRASLLASHDRDAVVRRKVAEDVETVARNGARRAAMATHPVTADDVAVEVGVAAAAVVLASDLRAPISHGAGAWGPGDPMAERDEDGYYPTKGIDTAAELAAAHESAKAWVDGQTRVKLQRVEMLLSDIPERLDTAKAPLPTNASCVRLALSIVRSLLGGE